MSTAVRHPAVAGRFYPAEPEVLLSDLQSYLVGGRKQLKAELVSAIGCVTPHAGYMYSGHVAGAVYAELDLPRRFIVMCPNHTGRGKPLAIMSQGSWQTPLGDFPIDVPLSRALISRFPLLTEDADAHHSEHAIEVHLPFLQILKPQATFVPIALGTGRFEVLQELGEGLADVVLSQSERVLIIASSDMNHYENDTITRIKDHKAIERILALDPRGLFDVVQKENISMCGFGPTVAMLTAAQRLGATRASLVKYATSGDVSGDRNMVVGYAGVVVS